MLGLLVIAGVCGALPAVSDAVRTRCPPDEAVNGTPHTTTTAEVR
jgi:hypothetical protein